MTIEIVSHTGQPVQIRNFSTDRYVDSSWVRRERDRLWRNSWLLAGLASDLQEVGDYLVFELGQEQILLTHTASGAIQGFYNVCQHRGNRLVASERGTADSFRCAYHAWTYGLDGALKTAPYRERFAAGIPCHERSLRPVATDIWDGFVFVSMAEQPRPLREDLGLVADHLAPYRFANMKLVEDQTVRLNCNWKAVVDNFCELYHVDFLHPQHKRMVDCCNDTVHLFPHGHTGLAVPGATVNPRFPVPDEPTDLQAAQLASLGLDPQAFRGRVLEVRQAVQARKREIGTANGVDYSAFRDDQLSDVWQYNLFPNVILSFTPEHCWVMRARPHPTDPAQCFFDKMTLLPMADPSTGVDQEVLGPGRAAEQVGLNQGEMPSRPVRDEFDHGAILDGSKTMTDTIDQDIELLGSVQAGMSSAGFNSVWLNDDEMRVQHFHDALDARLAG